MALRMRYRAAAALVAGVAASLVYAGSAFAATQWVNDNATATSNTSCAAPGFNTISAAVVAAAANDTIKVCAGTYNETVTVNKAGLILLGAKSGKDARSRAQTGESIVTGGPAKDLGFNLLANNVTVNGFTVKGVINGPGIRTDSGSSGHKLLNNIIQGNVFGIYANTGGGLQSLFRQNLIQNNNVAGSASGNGIYADQGTDHLTIAANAIKNEQNAGILLTSTGTTQDNAITVQGNNSQNNSSFIALFGNNSHVTITGNTTNDLVPGDDANQGSAIFVGDNATSILIGGNHVLNSPFSGIAVRGAFFTSQSPNGVDINNNRVNNAANNGIDVTDTQNGAVSVFQNVLRGNAANGIFFDALTSGNVIRGNNSQGSGDKDCRDDSGPTVGTGPVKNTWLNNIGVTSSPPGLCKPPT